MGALEWQLAGGQGSHQAVTGFFAQAVVEFDGTCLMYSHIHVIALISLKLVFIKEKMKGKKCIYHDMLEMLAPSALWEAEFL